MVVGRPSCQGLFSINAFPCMLRISSNKFQSAAVAKVLRTKTKPSAQFVPLKRSLRTFVPLMLTALENAVNECIGGSESEHLRTLLDVVAEVTDADSVFWMDSVNDLLMLMSRVVLSTSLEFRMSNLDDVDALLV